MSFNWGKSTNKGTAMMKLAHQFQDELLVRDEYVSWFFDESTINFFKANPFNVEREPIDDAEKFLRIAYWYINLREKYGDEAITKSIESGCKQLLLLGAGYDTRFFRLPCIQENSIATFEVDLPETIDDKKKYLIEKSGDIPQWLTLIPLDFNHDSLLSISNYGFDKNIPTAYIWQGVSYYLPKENVSTVLDFVKEQMAPGSIFVFDCCTPLMTYKNDEIPCIASNIDRLNEIGEPYLFGMYVDEMEAWLKEKGFETIKILQQDELEAKFLNQRTLPDNMWYVVTLMKH
jgi:methyltransferase (TIGR00027 family)